MKFRRASLLISCVIMLSGCRKKERVILPAFYYWKTSFSLSAAEASRVQDADCQRLYVRAFDVARDPETHLPKPIGIIRNLSAVPRTMSCVPVVFITQDALAGIERGAIGGLASNVASLLTTLWAALPPPAEVQIDCDWTASTRDAYFFLLESLRREPFFSGKKLSATIRLHQVKYRTRSGIPPVDRGMLMCYNMGALRNPATQNSILDPGTAKAYLAGLDTYPLPLDIALPIFSWCLQFRNGKFRGILRDVAPDSLAVNALFKRAESNIYSCTKDTFWAGYDFLAGDAVRVEASSAEQVLSVAHYTASRLRGDTLHVALFHLDGLPLAKHPPHELEAIFDAYR